jgi:hypothetical protein
MGGAQRDDQVQEALAGEEHGDQSRQRQGAGAESRGERDRQHGHEADTEGVEGTAAGRMPGEGEDSQRRPEEAGSNCPSARAQSTQRGHPTAGLA